MRHRCNLPDGLIVSNSREDVEQQNDEQSQREHEGVILPEARLNRAEERTSLST